MSRIGKKPVSIASGVEVTIKDDGVAVKGSKGELFVPVNFKLIEVKQEGAELVLTRLNETKVARSLHGLYRSLLNNAIIGVSTEFQRRLEIRGVGYRGSVKGKQLELYLGYSHSIFFDIPEGIEIAFDEKSQTVFSVTGIDKQKVGQVSAEIRSYRKPEPYKGKGVRYEDEYVPMKAGKSGKA